MAGKLTVLAILASLLFSNSMAQSSKENVLIFSTQNQLKALSDDAFQLRWKKLSADDQIKILKEANSNKTHPIRSKESSLRIVILNTPEFVSGSESSTLHKIYIEQVVDLASDIWEMPSTAKINDIYKKLALVKSLLSNSEVLPPRKANN